jgi:hypothetical protein
MGKNKNKNKPQQQGQVQSAPAHADRELEEEPEEGYGYEGSDNEAEVGETESRLQAALNSNPLRDGGEPSPPRRRKRFKITSAVDGGNVYLPANALKNEEADDSLLLCVGVYAFIQAFLFGALTPYLGVPHDMVMVSALGLLLLYVMWLSFCPRQNFGAVGSGSTYGVFIGASCFGALMGGVVGGANQYTRWPKLF